MNINRTKRYGDWNHQKSSNYRHRTGNHTSRRAIRTSSYKGILFCSYKGTKGEWSATIPPARNDPTAKKIVIGYYKKETTAIEARKQAMMARNKNVIDPATKRKRQRNERIKKNRMHTARASIIQTRQPIESTGNKIFHGKYQREHAWLPQQHQKHINRIKHTIDFHKGEVVQIRHDDHHSHHHGPYQLPEIENTSLQLGSNSITSKGNGNKIMMRKNMLDMHQLTRYARLDRERLRRNGPAAYNNMFQKQHRMVYVKPSHKDETYRMNGDIYY